MLRVSGVRFWGLRSLRFRAYGVYDPRAINTTLLTKMRLLLNCTILTCAKSTQQTAPTKKQMIVARESRKASDTSQTTTFKGGRTHSA